MSRISQLKKVSNEDLTKLLDKIDKSEQKYDNAKDLRYWTLKPDKEGNASATIRFLPPPEGEELPYVKYMSYSIHNKETNKYYIERSLASLDKKDPASEYYFKLSNSGDKKLQELAKTFNRRTNYVANILVVKDSSNPENNGRVFLFRFGQKILEKIKAKMKPADPDDDRIDVFHMIAGCNFRLRQRKVAGFPNYDNSEWDSPSPISKDDEVLEKIDSSLYSLSAEIAEDKYKDYETLKTNLGRVMGSIDESRSTSSTKASDDDEDEMDKDADFLSGKDDEDLPF